jgi:translation initiation factor IF-3
LVEVAPNAMPPVCRLVDFGKYRYEQAKREKESKKNQHATRVKEVQLSPTLKSIRMIWVSKSSTRSVFSARRTR